MTGGTRTDGTLTCASGSIASAVDISASGTVTGGTLTDGTITISGGDISNVSDLTVINLTGSDTLQKRREHH